MKTCVREKEEDFYGRAYSPVSFSSCLSPAKVFQQGFQDKSLWKCDFSLTGHADLSGLLTHFCLHNSHWKAWPPRPPPVSDCFWPLSSTVPVCFYILISQLNFLLLRIVLFLVKRREPRLHLTKVCLKRLFDLASRSDHFLVRGGKFQHVLKVGMQLLPAPPLHLVGLLQHVYEEVMSRRGR